MQVTHEPWLVALSLIVAIQGAFVGLSLAVQVAGADGLRRRLLLAGAAISLAVAIWSMHFVGMLAARLPIPVDYLVFPTLLKQLNEGVKEELSQKIPDYAAAVTQLKSGLNAFSQQADALAKVFAKIKDEKSAPDLVRADAQAAEPRACHRAVRPGGSPSAGRGVAGGCHEMDQRQL